MPAETATAICTVLMGGILERFPRLKICFAHGGGSFPYTVGRIQHGYKVRPDLCATDCQKAPRDFLGKFWTDSLVHDEEAMRLLVNVIGEVCGIRSKLFRSQSRDSFSFSPQDRIILGSDYPFPLGEVYGFAGAYPGKIIESTYASNEKLRKKLLFDNAVDFLGLDGSKFL